jgi:hypothetical protein
MDERESERVLARELKSRTALRRLPDPPTALRDAARDPERRRAADGRTGRAGIGADLAWVAALAACLACSVAFGRVDTALAERLDDPAIARAVRDALSPSSLAALGLSLGDGRK